MFERSQGFRSLGRILVQNEKFLIIWLFVMLFLHVCQHSFPYVSQPSPTDLPPQATESRCQKGESLSVLYTVCGDYFYLLFAVFTYISVYSHLPFEEFTYVYRLWYYVY